jgi:hypothetical protein
MGKVGREVGEGVGTVEGDRVGALVGDAVGVRRITWNLPAHVDAPVQPCHKLNVSHLDDDGTV